MNFATLGLQLCSEETPTFLWLFDLSTSPPLLYYSYIPIVIASLLIGVYVFVKDKKSLKSRLLLSITVFFVLWVINILVQWVASYHTVLMFGWQLTAIFEVGMFLSAAYFARVFLNDSDISLAEKLILFILAIATLVAIPTGFNVAAYDIENCEGTNGLLWNIIYALEPAIIVLIAWWGLLAYRQRRDTVRRKQITIFTIGIVLFLTTFFLSNYYGELTKVYEFNLWGPIGMVVFLILLEYLIVRYHTFNIKLFATQGLVVATTLLIGSQLFTPSNVLDLSITIVTLITFWVSGVFLVRSVKLEIEHREEIEKLAGELQETNERQEGLIHFIGHEVKGFLTKDMGAFAAISQGDFGAPPDGMKPFVEHALIESRQGASSVENILKAANLKKGTVTYTKEPFDLKTLIAEMIEKEKPMAAEKGLILSFTADESSYQMTGDKAQLGDHVLRNLIDNSINYTPSGTVVVSLKKDPSTMLGTRGKLVFAVKDTGIGISDEDKKLLFTEGGHGKDSQKTNIHSTGYGLYIAKNIVEAHGGTIRAESEGEGKGSTFVVELPV